MTARVWRDVDGGGKARAVKAPSFLFFIFLCCASSVPTAFAIRALQPSAHPLARPPPSTTTTVRRKKRRGPVPPFVHNQPSLLVVLRLAGISGLVAGGIASCTTRVDSVLSCRRCCPHCHCRHPFWGRSIPHRTTHTTPTTPVGGRLCFFFFWYGSERIPRCPAIAAPSNPTLLHPYRRRRRR
jgi:hypothetical protein